jgi:hypothetical protein
MNGMAQVNANPLRWAREHSPERIVALGVLGIRLSLYQGEQQPAVALSSGSLSVHASTSNERPTWHEATRLYGFLRLPSGKCRITAADPSLRLLPWAISAIVPNRSEMRLALERGGSPPPDARTAAALDIALRPAPAAPLLPGLTAIRGVVLEQDDTPLALARLALDTVFDGTPGRVVTWSARDGAFVIVLPGERTSSLHTPPVVSFDRTLTIHTPTPALSARLRGPDYIAALPADLDTLDPDDPAGDFRQRDFRLRDPDGALSAKNAALNVRAAQVSRWDIALQP